MTVAVLTEKGSPVRTQWVELGVSKLGSQKHSLFLTERKDDSKHGIKIPKGRTKDLGKSFPGSPPGP